MDRDQLKFIQHCKRNLPDYPLLLKEAKAAAERARQSCTMEHQKANAAVRAGNVVLLLALKSKGVQAWRDTTQ